MYPSTLQEEQWSQINLTGNKYGRQFIMNLQYESLSLIKPDNLPHIEIVKVFSILLKGIKYKMNEMNVYGLLSRST